MTNGDKIRAMSDEELAEYFIYWCPQPPEREMEKLEYKCGDCQACRFEWLIKEAEE